MAYNKYFNSQLINEIDRAISNHDLDSAEELIQSYIASYPHDYLIYIYKARLLSMQHKNEQAIELAKQYISYDFGKEKNYITAYTIYADVLADSGLIDQAEYYYRKAISLSIETDTVSRARIKLINLFISLNQHEDALELCEGHENCNNILVKKGIINSYLGRYQEVIDALLKVDTTAINKYLLQNVNYYLGNAYFKLNDKDTAMDYLHRALNIKGTFIYVKALADIGFIYLNNFEYDKVIQMGNRIIRENNNPYFGLDLLASVYTEIREYDLALKNIVKIENNFKHYSKLATLYYRTKKFGDAEECMYHVLSEQTDNLFEFHITLYALILFRLGKINTLRSLFDNVIDEEEIRNHDIDMLRTHLSMLDGKCRAYSYSTSQYYHFDKEKAIEYIREKHFIDPMMSSFNDSNIRELYEDITSRLNIEDSVPVDFFDKYFIREDGVGTDGINELDELVAVTLPNTTNIITMYPKIGDDTSMYDEYGKVNVRRKSQIEKFNDRYKK